MKKSISNIGRILTKAQQKQVHGGNKIPSKACGCSADFTELPGGGNFCTFNPNGPLSGVGACLGTIQNGQCCV